MSTRPPLGGNTTWTTVMARAERRCQCEGACDRPHSGRERCPEVDTRRRRLVVAPADPRITRPVAAARTPVSELAAWCTPCLASAHAIVYARRECRIL